MKALTLFILAWPAYAAAQTPARGPDAGPAAPASVLRRVDPAIAAPVSIREPLPRSSR